MTGQNHTKYFHETKTPTNVLINFTLGQHALLRYEKFEMMPTHHKPVLMAQPHAYLLESPDRILGGVSQVMHSSFPYHNRGMDTLYHWFIIGESRIRAQGEDKPLV